MKPIVLTLSLTLATLFAYCQNFEGEIVYKVNVITTLPSALQQQLVTMIGNQQEYYISNGYYKSLSNGALVTMELYDKPANRIYHTKPKSDTLYWFDASVNSDSVTGYEIRKNAETVLGYTCDVMVVKTTQQTLTYYYCDKFKLNSRDYTKHQYGNWDFFTAKCGTLPLKTIIERGQFKVESVATEILPMKLEASFFKVRAGGPVKMSFE